MDERKSARPATKEAELKCAPSQRSALWKFSLTLSVLCLFFQMHCDVFCLVWLHVAHSLIIKEAPFILHSAFGEWFPFSRSAPIRRQNNNFFFIFVSCFGWFLFLVFDGKMQARTWITLSAIFIIYCERHYTIWTQTYTFSFRCPGEMIRTHRAVYFPIINEKSMEKFHRSATAKTRPIVCDSGSNFQDITACVASTAMTGWQK